MAKDKNAAAPKDEVVDTFDNIGGSDSSRTVKEQDPFENLPSFVPDKNWKVGRKLCGRVVGSKRIFSDKFTAGKLVNGKMSRMRHILEDTKGQKFVLWGVGALDVIMDRVVPGQYVEIEFKGRAEKPLKAGQTPPYVFGVFSDQPLRDLDSMEQEMAQVEDHG